ncbi:MAG: ABC transporter substrate binding protein [Gallionella sp.]|nr:ABC transporter substrate binding protein [Gallionella sp.]
MFRQIAILLLSSTVMLMTAGVQAGTLNVSLLLSDSSPPYRQFAASFNQALAASKADVTVVESQDASSTHADLIVAVGMKATGLAAAQAGIPVLAVMIPETGYQELLAQTSRQIPARAITAIYLNQPWDRQFDFLHAALPERRRIGLLHSPDTRIDVEGLRQRIARRGGSLVALPVRSAERLFPSLESVLEGSDLLLAIPDSAIYNSSNIRNILLDSYRKGVPLIGLSQSYVNAGALCAVFSTTEQMAEQAGATVISFLRNSQLPDPQYPADFTIAVNQQVARSLGIELPSPETIRSQMGKTQMGKDRRRER